MGGHGGRRYDATRSEKNEYRNDVIICDLGWFS